MLIALIGGFNSVVLSIAASRSSSAETLPEATRPAWPTPSTNCVWRARSDNDMLTVLSISIERDKAGRLTMPWIHQIAQVCRVIQAQLNR